MNHKTWVNNEYRQWIEALESCSVQDFKENAMVKRMLGDIQWPAEFQIDLSMEDKELITRIDNIGRKRKGQISGACHRMIYYASQVLARKPRGIIEIGGGVGQFYAIMRALGYAGTYCIIDLPEVERFQQYYLDEVSRQTGLVFPIRLRYDFCISFFALGEFDDEWKERYIETIIKKCPHGFIIWNPHSGASDVINFPCKIEAEHPKLLMGNPRLKRLTW